MQLAIVATVKIEQNNIAIFFNNLQVIFITHYPIYQSKPPTKTMEGFLNYLLKFNNSLLDLFFLAFSIKTVSFRESHYIKIALTLYFQAFYDSNLLASVIPSLLFILFTLFKNVQNTGFQFIACWEIRSILAFFRLFYPSQSQFQIKLQ